MAKASCRATHRNHSPRNVHYFIPATRRCSMLLVRWTSLLTLRGSYPTTRCQQLTTNHYARCCQHAALSHPVYIFTLCMNRVGDVRQVLDLEHLSLYDDAFQIEETTAEEWRRVMAVNVDGAFFMTQACRLTPICWHPAKLTPTSLQAVVGGMLKKKWGRIVNMSSWAWKVSWGSKRACTCVQTPRRIHLAWYYIF